LISSNISVIKLWSVILWRKPEYLEKTTDLFKSLTKHFHIVVIVTDYLGSCRFDNHVVLVKLWSQSWQHHVDPYFEVILTSDWEMKNNNKSTKSTVLQCFVYQSFIWIVFHVQSLLLCISFHVFYSFNPKLIVILKDFLMFFLRWMFGMPRRNNLSYDGNECYIALPIWSLLSEWNL
jgi:hypothetical protein